MLSFLDKIIQTYLEPSERLGEVLFGLVMVLTFTLGAGMVVAEGREGVRQLLLATIGCNVAWGLIDAVIYIMLRMSERARRMNGAARIRAVKNDEEAVDIIRREMDYGYAELMSVELKDRFSREILGFVRGMELKKIRIEKNDFLGGLASFTLVFISTVPAAIPFLFFSDPHRALRVSNLLLIGFLFLVGYRWARQTHTNRVLGGLSMMTIGIVLVGVAMLLGG